MSDDDDERRASEVLPYASPAQRARPQLAWFALPAVASVFLELIFTRAGNLGKLDYDWRAALGIAMVFCGIVTYVVGRVICRRPRGSGRRGESA